MGLLVLNYTTNEGFLVPQLYIQVTGIRMLKTLQGPNYGMYYSSLAYKSLDDKEAGASPVAVPAYLATVQQYLTADDFYDQTIFGFAYGAIKAAWEAAGYVVEDYYPHPPTPTTYIYDCSGYSFRGFNCAGYTVDGYGKDGFNRQGYDRQGYDRQGFNAQGYNRQGYDKDGFNQEGYDSEGYDRDGFNKDGWNRQQRDRNGFDPYGYGPDGYNGEGYDRLGYDRDGYDRDGYNRQGCNRDGVDKDGNPCPTPQPE